jgi:Cys-tRNA(Pro) deacylase
MIEDLRDWLEAERVWYRFIDKPETTHTADASKAVGVNLERLTKNLVAVTDSGEHVLIVVPGNLKVDLKKVASVLGAKNVSLVPFSEAEKYSGYLPGATPSVHHKEKLRVIIDRLLTDYQTLFCGGGSRERLLELKVEDVIRLDDGIVADISKPIISQ